MEWFFENDTRLAAWATVAAVAVALAIPLLQAWWRWLSRPVLTLEFRNEEPWRRRSMIVGTGGVRGLFFRIRVTNTGWSTAHNVMGRLTKVFGRDDAPVQPIDPVTLHWAGSQFAPGSTGVIDLLPGQAEYLDVLRVDSSPGQPLTDQDEFNLIVQDGTPRGTLTQLPIAGQRLTVFVSASNAAGAGLEFLLPETQPFPNRFLSVKHRRLDRYGLALYPWDEQPPPGIVGDAFLGGTDAITATTAPTTGATVTPRR